jgi:hypothetical protein
MNDYSEETAWWASKVAEIQSSLRGGRWAEAHAKIEEMQASMVKVAGWLDERHGSANG